MPFRSCSCEIHQDRYHDWPSENAALRIASCMRVCPYCGYRAANATNLRVHLRTMQYKSRNLVVKAESKGRAGNKLRSTCTSFSRTVLLTQCVELRHPSWEPLSPTHCKDVVPSPQTSSKPVSTMGLHCQAPVSHSEYLIATRSIYIGKRAQAYPHTGG